MRVPHAVTAAQIEEGRERLRQQEQVVESLDVRCVVIGVSSSIRQLKHPTLSIGSQMLNGLSKN